MKKLISLLMVVAMLMAFVACGGESETEGTSGVSKVDVEAKYGIDLDGEGEQTMASDRAQKSVLVETRDVWLEGKITFMLDETPKTYEDFVAHIGCDASTYSYSVEDAERSYTWIAQDDETAKFKAVFWETPQGWTLYTVGSTNL